MLIKVKIQTDEKGKYYNHKKKKTYIASKCVKLLPKKDDFNIYVNDDGVKYYHIGYKKVYLGNDIQVSKNVCGDLEKVFSHKKRKLDKVIVESIEEIKKVKKGKKRAKKAKTKEAVESIRGVIKNDLLDNKVKDEDFTNKKPQKLTYAQTRAKLIQANDKVQQIKNDAEAKGYTKDQKARVVSEAKQLITMTPEQRQLQQAQSTLPALNSLYGSSLDWTYNKEGLPIFPPQDRKIEKKTADEMVKEKLEQREKADEEWLEENPPIKLEKPKKTIISSIFGGMFNKPPPPKSVVEEEETKDSDDESDEESVVSSVASKTPSLASNLPPMSSEERSKKTAILELETRLLDIQNYIDKDIKDIERYKIHLELLNEATIPEKKKVKKIKTEVNARRKQLIEDYKQYVGDIIPVFVQSEKENPFSADVIKKFGKKKIVEKILKQIHQVEVEDSKPKTIDSYNQLNMLVDSAKHKPEFRKKSIDSSVDRHIQQLERFTNRLEKGSMLGSDFNDRIDYTTDILKRFKPSGDGAFKIPTKLYTYITQGGEIGYGRAKPIAGTGMFKNKISNWGAISAGLEEEPDYYSNSAFDSDVYYNIKKDIRSKFSNTQSSLLTDEMFDRAYFGDKLDKDEVVDSGVIKGNKKSASSGLDVLTGASQVLSTMTSTTMTFDEPPSPEGKASSIDSFDRNMLAQGAPDDFDEDYVAYQEYQGGATTPIPDY